MNTTYQTLIVKFSEPITALDGIFDEAQAWGTNTLKGWIDDYESTLAAECGVSRAAIHQRVQRLIDLGVIVGSGYHVNPKSLG